MADDTGANPPAPTVSEGGTTRDFGNMLNYYRPRKHIPNHVRKKQGEFSPWTKMPKGYKK